MLFVHFFWLHHNYLTVLGKKTRWQILCVKSSFSTIYHRDRGNCGGYGLWKIPFTGEMMGTDRFSVAPVLDRSVRLSSIKA